MLSRLTYANVMSTIAVFVALGGGAYAAVKLPKNSVGAKQIRKNAVTSAKVKNGSLTKSDFKKGSIPAGPQGLQGPQGVPGQPGAQGPAGPTGPKGADAPGTTLFARLADVPAAPAETDLVKIPGVATVKVSCAGRGTSNVGFGVKIYNDSTAPIVGLWRTEENLDGASPVSDNGGTQITASTEFSRDFAQTTNGQVGRSFQFTATSQPAFKLDVVAVTNNNDERCQSSARVVVAP